MNTDSLGQFTTTDDSSHLYWLFGPPSGAPNVTVQFDLLLAARASDGTSAAWWIRGTAKTVGGTMSLVGSPDVAAQADSGASSWTYSLTTSGGSISLSVAGAAGTKIVWVGVAMPRAYLPGNGLQSWTATYQ